MPMIQRFMAGFAGILFMVGAITWFVSSKPDAQVQGVIDSQDKKSFTYLSPLASNQLMKNKGQNLVVVDIRTNQEFQTGHLPGAQVHDVYQPEFEKNLQNLDKTKSFLFYDQNQLRLDENQTKIQNAELNEVYFLSGGLTAWQINGLEISKK